MDRKERVEEGTAVLEAVRGERERALMAKEMARLRHGAAAKRARAARLRYRAAQLEERAMVAERKATMMETNHPPSSEQDFVRLPR